MPKSPASPLAQLLVAELRKFLETNPRDYPPTLSTLAERLDPKLDDAAILKAAASKPFKSDAVVAITKRTDTPVSLIADTDRLAASPLTLEAAFASKTSKGKPPWTPKQLAGALQKPLQSRFQSLLEEQIRSDQLPSFAVVVKHGRTLKLHHKDRPPPPPPPSTEVQLATRLVAALRDREAAGDGQYPLTLRQLADACDVTVENATFQKTLKKPLSEVIDELTKLKEDGYISHATWDRLTAARIDAVRITPNQGRQIIEARLEDFLKDFEDVPEVAQHLKTDTLFPLGTKWFDERFGKLIEVRPRKLIVSTRERWLEIQQQLANAPDKRAWLKGWPDGKLVVKSPDRVLGVRRSGRPGGEGGAAATGVPGRLAELHGGTRGRAGLRPATGAASPRDRRRPLCRSASACRCHVPRRR